MDLLTVTLPDFTTVTEAPGVRASRAELGQMYTRYHWAAGFVAGRRVLELGCGSGPGLGYLLAHKAAKVIGTDIEDRNLVHARKHYQDRKDLELAVIDAQSLPYSAASFDIVLLFEAIYYLPDAQRFLVEARRVLAPGGVLLISTVNCEWPQFNPSPFSHWYPSAMDLAKALSAAGFKPTIKGGFPDHPAGFVRRIISLIRRTAVRWRLIPNTMKGKEFLKRIFYGRLESVPYELADGAYDLEPLVLIPMDSPNHHHIFLYAEGRVPT